MSALFQELETYVIILSIILCHIVPLHKVVEYIWFGSREEVAKTIWRFWALTFGPQAIVSQLCVSYSWVLNPLMFRLVLTSRDVLLAFLAVLESKAIEEK